MAHASAAIPRHPGLCPGRYLSACEDGDLGRGNHQGQRSRAPREQAGHKTASDKMPITSKKSCFAGAIHTGQSRHPVNVGFRNLVCSVPRRQPCMNVVIEPNNALFPFRNFQFKPFGLGSNANIAFLSQAGHLEGHGRG